MPSFKVGQLWKGDGDFKSSFLSCGKDVRTIVEKLFVNSRPYSDYLKKLLIINTPDCVSANNSKYDKIVKDYSIADMRKDGYIRVTPRLTFGENEEIKSYIIISFDNFVSNSGNGYYRDCIVEIDVLCNLEEWELTDFEIRPLKIAGYIDGILNNAKLSGIGTLDFIGCNEIVLSEQLSGYCLMYRATHGVDDLIEEPEDE